MRKIIYRRINPLDLDPQTLTAELKGGIQQNMMQIPRRHCHQFPGILHIGQSMKAHLPRDFLNNARMTFTRKMIPVGQCRNFHRSHQSPTPRHFKRKEPRSRPNIQHPHGLHVIGQTKGLKIAAIIKRTRRHQSFAQINRVIPKQTRINHQAKGVTLPLEGRNHTSLLIQSAHKWGTIVKANSFILEYPLRSSHRKNQASKH